MLGFFGKKREKFLLFIFMLVMFSIFADSSSANRDLVSYENLKINVEGSGQVAIVQTNSDPYVEYYTANLTFFPRSDETNQIILNQKFESNPNSQISSGEDGVLYKWDKPVAGTLSFGFDAEIFNSINFPKIREKIAFPVKLENQKFWEYLGSTELIHPEDIETKRIATQIVAGEDDLYEAVHKIASWVNENVRYLSNTETAEVSRDSKWVLLNRVGVCDEITNLFVAMARSVGIPAKFMSGVAYSNQINDFGNHAWAEVYFPGVGWVPFDATYGEYGFADSTHIKFKDGIDGASSVDYVWRGRGIESEIKGFKIQTTIAETSPHVKWNFEAAVDVLKDNVDAGSYAPVMITIKNKEPYYLPITLYVVKAPTDLGDNRLEALVPPLSEKKIFTIVQIPSDLNKKYSYLSIFEVMDFFEQVSASNIIHYGSQNDHYSYENAKLMVANLNEESVKYYPDLITNCTFDKDVYYISDIMNAKCYIENKGNVNLNNVRACIHKECQNFDLFITDKKEMNFAVPSTPDSDEVILDITSDEMARHEYFNIKTYPKPDLKFTGISIPDSISYGNTTEIRFNTSVNSPLKKVNIKICGRNFFNIETLKGDDNFIVPVYGSFFYGKDCEIKAYYQDMGGNNYEKSISLPMIVTDVPFYARYSLLIIIPAIAIISAFIIMLIRKTMKHHIAISAPHKRASHIARKDLFEMMPHKHKRHKTYEKTKKKKGF